MEEQSWGRGRGICECVCVNVLFFKPSLPVLPRPEVWCFEKDARLAANDLTVRTRGESDEWVRRMRWSKLILKVGRRPSKEDRFSPLFHWHDWSRPGVCGIAVGAGRHSIQERQTLLIPSSTVTIKSPLAGPVTRPCLKKESDVIEVMAPAV